MGWWGDNEPSRPREVTGGIKARNVRGASWWGKRWIDTLDSVGLGSRLGRGRTYARKGQVTAIEVSVGEATAKVQGSRPKPYAVKIQVRPLSAAEWDHVREAIRQQPILAAKLLAGEMPQDIENVFQTAGVTLFPKTGNDLKTDCSCPDWSNPCKHVAAVYILLGEEFDRDPFLLFRLRGMERTELLEGIAESGPQGESVAPEPEPLPTDPAIYWNGAPVAEGMARSSGDLRKPPVTAPLLKRLGRFPFWRAEEDLVDALSQLYNAASGTAADAYLGRRPAAHDISIE